MSINEEILAIVKKVLHDHSMHCLDDIEERNRVSRAMAKAVRTLVVKPVRTTLEIGTVVKATTSIGSLNKGNIGVVYNMRLSDGMLLVYVRYTTGQSILYPGADLDTCLKVIGD